MFFLHCAGFRFQPRTVSHINLIEQKFEILTLAACNRQRGGMQGMGMGLGVIHRREDGWQFTRTSDSGPDNQSITVLLCASSLETNAVAIRNMQKSTRASVAPAPAESAGSAPAPVPARVPETVPSRFLLPVPAFWSAKQPVNNMQWQLRIFF